MTNAPQRTRASLLLRVRDLEDTQAWQEFVRIYTPLVFGHCARHGLQEADAADRGGRTTYFYHDPLKRLTGILNPEGGTTRFGYDGNGNQTLLTDPKGNVTYFTYDLDNRLVRKTYADGRSLAFRYDSGGLLTTRTNARGISTAYTYDANHNLLTTTYSDDTPGVTNTYDSFNRLTNIVDGVGRQIYGYDANSRLTSFDGAWVDDTITYAYDALGRRTNLLVQGSEATGYQYDALNRLTGVRVGTQSYAYSYAGASPLGQRLDRPNGSYTTYQYDGLNRLTTLSNRRSSGAVINEFSYTYNSQDLRDSETVSNGLALTFTNQLATCNYNGLNQLLTSGPPSSLVFTSASPHQVFAYDEDGNMTRGFTPEGLPFTATYDAEDRLQSLTITNGSGDIQTMDYRYRGYGFMARVRAYYNGTLSNETRFVREGSTPVQERRADNNLSREYAWGHHIGGGIGGLLDLKQGGQEYSYLYDGGWNVVGLLDNTQAVAVGYAYEPFGGLQTVSGALDQPFRFSTKRYDATTGLSDYGYRSYSTVLGRWSTRDPIAERGGLNLYEFVGSDPINRLDPLGLEDHHIDLVIEGEGVNVEYEQSLPAPPGTLPGAFIVSAHGNPNGVYENHQYVDPAALWRRISWDVSFDRSKTTAIVLLSCQTAGKYAQELANMSGLIVYAPELFISLKDGQLKYSHTDVIDGVKYTASGEPGLKPYYPQ